MNAVEATGFTLRVGQKVLLDDVSLSLEAGVSHAIVGERGSGKTGLLRAMVGMWPSEAVVSGRLWVNGVDLVGLDEPQRRAARRRGLLYLPPSGRDSLNPVEQIGSQIEDVCSVTRPDGVSRSEYAQRSRIRTVATLRQLGIADPDRVLSALPDELSGGMNKRVLLTMALLVRAQLLAADEPTTGLDVTIQRQILDLVKQLQNAEGFTLVIATQSLGIVAHYASTITVLESGRIVEATTPERFFSQPDSSVGVAMLERARAW